MRILLWFRGTDLRLRDHPALVDACRRSTELVPVFVLSPAYFLAERLAVAPHRMQYLLASLHELSAELFERGSRLLVVHGPAERAIPLLCEQLRIDEVVACLGTEPAARKRDAAISGKLAQKLTLHQGETLAPPGSIRTGGDDMFQVFTPFARALRTRVQVREPLPAPRRIPMLPALPDSLGGVQWAQLPSLAELGLHENPRLIAGGEHAARERLRRFVRKTAERYDTDRDRMDLAGTSRLSADLHFGTLSVRTAYHEATRYLENDAPKALDRFQLELSWREFAYHWLWERPSLLQRPFREAFEGFPWRDDADAWRAWATGTTGYPVVDAAARQLLDEGYVHNRARMVSASFLTKHLLIDYARGEAHYMRWLVDGDVANNNLGWQWSAGCGCDAQPYFRIFHPVTQGERFDPQGDYVRRWVPELAKLPTKYLHAPWTAPQEVLRAAGVELGLSYPQPIVDHKQARARFLQVAKAHLKREPGPATEIDDRS